MAVVGVPPMVSVVAAPPIFKVVDTVLKASNEAPPITDVTKDGEVAASNKATPVPFSSVNAPLKLALDGVPKKVKIPVPVVVVLGATPAPPPITIALAANAALEAHVEVELK